MAMLDLPGTENLRTSPCTATIQQSTTSVSRKESGSNSNFPRKKQSVPAEQDKKPSAETKKPTITPTPNAQKSKGEASPSKPAPSSKVEQTKEESSFFGFGFGGARSRSPSPQSAVSEKVMGFGSSFLSSTSNLISSAVQNESSTKTPPSSRKGSTVSQSSVKMTPTPPTSRKGSEASQATQKNKPAEEAKLITAQKRDEREQEGNKPQGEMTKEPVADVKINRPVPELPKACPLCKVDIKRDPPNYNTCTECKDTVCNLCGFNPMPHQTEVRVLHLFLWISVSCTCISYCINSINSVSNQCNFKNIFYYFNSNYPTG